MDRIMDTLNKRSADSWAKAVHAKQVVLTKQADDLGESRVIYDGYHINGVDARSDRAKELWSSMSEEAKLRYCMGLKQRRKL